MILESLLKYIFCPKTSYTEIFVRPTQSMQWWFWGRWCTTMPLLTKKMLKTVCFKKLNHVSVFSIKWIDPPLKTWPRNNMKKKNISRHPVYQR